jgi:RNA polymerase sigma-70 factor (ECF subfamily)
LFDRYAGQLYALGLRFCGNGDEAEDLVQEVMLAAFRNWDQFDGRAKPSTWFYTIASRACQRRHRLRAGEPARMASFEDLLPSSEGYVADLRELQSDPLDDQLQRETRDAVETAIATLPIEFRMPLVLKEIADLSLEEIAAVTGVPKATVKTRVHRGRLRLRKEFDRRIGGRPAPESARPPGVCLDLLEAKLEAMDRGLEGIARDLDGPLCERCEAVFSGLDAVRHACGEMGGECLPSEVRQRLEHQLRETSLVHGSVP